MPPPAMPRMPTLAELDKAAPEESRVLVDAGLQRALGHQPLGKKFFESPIGRSRSAPTASIASRAGSHAAVRLLVAACRRCSTPQKRGRGAIDAMAYGLSLGVTTHLDQGGFQAARNTPSDGAAHDDNYRCYDSPFVALHREGKLSGAPAHQLPPHGRDA